METLYFVLLLVSAVCFAVAAFRRATGDVAPGARSVNVNYVALGLLAWVLVPLLETLQALGD